MKKAFRSCVIATLGIILPLWAQSGAQALATPYRIEFNGKRYFLNGINVAWNQWSNDFNGTSYNRQKFIDMFKAIKAAGGNSVRMWIHCDGAQSPSFASDGSVTGVADGFRENVKMFLDDAHANGILVMYCIWSFEIAEKKPKLLSSDAVLDSYFSKVLKPMATYVKDHPALLSWEIINEPEWMENRTTWDRIQRFIGRHAAALREVDRNVLLNVGCGYFKNLVPEGNNARKNYFSDAELRRAAGNDLAYVDFYQTHFYSWMLGDGWTWSPYDYRYWSNVDKPIIIGEFPAKGISGYMSSLDMHTKAVELGYAGTMSWAYFDNRNDKAGYWPDARPGVEAIYALIPGAVKGEGVSRIAANQQSIAAAPVIVASTCRAPGFSNLLGRRSSPAPADMQHRVSAAQFVVWRGSIGKAAEHGVLMSWPDRRN